MKARLPDGRPWWCGPPRTLDDAYAEREPPPEPTEAEKAQWEQGTRAVFNWYQSTLGDPPFGEFPFPNAREVGACICGPQSDPGPLTGRCARCYGEASDAQRLAQLAREGPSRNGEPIPGWPRGGAIRAEALKLFAQRMDGSVFPGVPLGTEEGGGAIVPSEFAEDVLVLIQGKPPPVRPTAKRYTYEHPDCCERGRIDVERATLEGGKPSVWCVTNTDGEGVGGIAFCPFCGAKLP